MWPGNCPIAIESIAAWYYLRRFTDKSEIGSRANLIDIVYINTVL